MLLMKMSLALLFGVLVWKRGISRVKGGLSPGAAPNLNPRKEN